jgi:hypothetical protein
VPAPTLYQNLEYPSPIPFASGMDAREVRFGRLALAQGGEAIAGPAKLSTDGDPALSPSLHRCALLLTASCGVRQGRWHCTEDATSLPHNVATTGGDSGGSRRGREVQDIGDSGGRRRGRKFMKRMRMRRPVFHQCALLLTAPCGVRRGRWRYNEDALGAAMDVSATNRGPRYAFTNTR